MEINAAKEHIVQYYSQMPKNKVFNYIKTHDTELFDFIEHYYAWPPGTKSMVKLLWVSTGLTEIPKCVVCGKSLDINQVNPKTGKYRLHCSHYCGCHSEHARSEYRRTCMEKYGVEHNMKSVDGRDEYYRGLLEKYGVDRITKVGAVKQKILDTIRRKYGADSISKSPEIARKISNSLNARTEDEKRASVLKRKRTKLDRYGDENFVNHEKAKSTNFARYGVECIFKSDRVKALSSAATKKQSYDLLLENTLDLPLFSYDEYAARESDLAFLLFKCRACGKEFLSRHHDGSHDSCPDCYPKEAGHEEKVFAKFIRNTCGESVIENTRTVISPLELDVFVPVKKIAFEFDGLYWHSEQILSGKQHKNPMSYHLEKTCKCETAGIRLIHVFENEWLFKRKIVESRIENMFGIHGKTVYARKCEIREIDSKTASDFVDENHMQGYAEASVSIGLFFENELVSLMTFCRCRFDRKHEWEMLRFCNKCGYHIPGAAGRLLKYFERKYGPRSLVTYADRRWSQGKLYKALGFVLDHISKPNYWYFDLKKKQLESRIKYQKHKLKNILPIFDPFKTEIQNMANNGFFRIFDCGNYVFTKTY